MAEHILALDVGTSTVKAAVLNTADRSPIAPPVRVPYDLHSPEPDAFEIPPERLRAAVWSAAKQAVNATGAHSVGSAATPGSAGKPESGVRIDGIGLSCLMPALVLLDAQDEPLAPIWIHLDRRARPVARQVQSDVGAEFLATCGNRPLPGGMSVLCYRKIIEERPDLAGRVRRYLHANGWLAYLMTGTAAYDRGNASFTGLFNTVTDRQWSSRWCDYFGIDRRTLPDVVCGSTVIGGLNAATAAEWGLPVGTPVRIGTADTSSAMLSADMKPGDMLHSVGTTQVLAVLVRDPKPDPRRLTRLFGVDDWYVYVAHNPVGGSALGWVHQLCFRDQSIDTFFERTVPQCATLRPTVTLDPPYLGGDRLEIDAKYASFKNLALTTEREELLTAVLDGMRTGHRQAYQALDLGHQVPSRIVLTGGGSEIVRRLLPEYADRNIVPIDEGAMRGVAALFRPRTVV